MTITSAPCDVDRRRDKLLQRPARRSSPLTDTIQLAAYDGISHVIAHQAIETAVAGSSGFVVRAQGYGFFSGNDGRDRSLHVPVVRSPPLDALHEAIHGALVSAGADVAGWTAPSHWSPHITLAEGGLDPDSIGAAAAALAKAPPPLMADTGPRPPSGGKSP